MLTMKSLYLNSFRNWCRKNRITAPGSILPIRKKRALRSEKLLLEHLEDRTVPSTLAFDKALLGTSINNAHNDNNHAVVGELVNYQLILTVPEAGTVNSQIVDTLPSGLAFVGMNSSVADPALTIGGSLTPVITNSGQTVTFTPGNITNSDVNAGNAENIVLTYQAVVLDVAGNVGSPATTLQNSAQYTDTTPGSSITKSAANVTVIEPQLQITKSASISTGQAGDTITYTMVITNGGASQTDAFDVSVTDALPSHETYVAGSLTQTTSSGGVSAPTFGVGPTFPATYSSFPLGGSSTLQFQAKIATTANPAEVLANTATATWTSLSGSPGQISTFNASSTERSGAGGVDNYTVTSNAANVTVISPIISKTLTVTSISNSNNSNTQVVIGEQATYSITIKIPQGTTPNAHVVDTLPAGLAFVAMDPNFPFANSNAGQVTSSNGFANASNPIISNSGHTIDFDLGTITNVNTNDFIDETLNLEYSVVVLNIPSNVTGQTLSNSAVFNWTNPANQQIGPAVAGAVTVIEPKLQTTKNVTLPTGGGYPGAPITYTIVIQHTGVVGDTDAYDATLSDLIPSSIISPAIVSVSDTQSQVNLSNFQIIGNTLSNTGTGFFLSLQNTVTITVSGTVDPLAAGHQIITNTENLEWTSISGSPGQITANNSNAYERTGSGVLGSPNNYNASSFATFTVPESDISVNVAATTPQPVYGFVNTLFTVTVTNLGPELATGLTITDVLPALPGGMTWIPVASQGSFSVSTWTVGNLGVGNSATLLLTTRVTVLLPFGLTDTATKLHVDQVDLVAGNDSSSVSVNETPILGTGTPLNLAADYNAFILHDSDVNSSDSEGRFAVGGNASFTGYSVGAKASNALSNTVVAGGNLNYTNGTVYHGNAVYGGTGTFNSFDIPNGSTIHQSGVIDFFGAELNLKEEAIFLSAQSPNGTSFVHYGTLVLYGDNPGLNYFSVTGTQLASVNSLFICVPAGGSAIVSVSGTNDQMINIGTQFFGIGPQNTLFNFYEATSLNISQIAVPGSILAPLADVNFTGANINGTLVAKSLHGNGEFHNIACVIDRNDITQHPVYAQLGTYDPSNSNFTLKNTNVFGGSDQTFQFGQPGFDLAPLFGDWTGSTGYSTIGAYNPHNSHFLLRFTNDVGPANIDFQFGSPGFGLIPLVGDWDGNGSVTGGLYDPASFTFMLTNTNNVGAIANYTFQFFGDNASYHGQIPFAGDWNNDGTTTIGLYDPSTGVFSLTNTDPVAGTAATDITFSFDLAPAGALPIAGDWNSNGPNNTRLDTVGLYDIVHNAFNMKNSNANNTHSVTDMINDYSGTGQLPIVGKARLTKIVDTLGIYNSATAAFSERNFNTTGPVNNTFTFGANNLKGISGDWTGSGKSGVGSYDGTTGTFYLRNADGSSVAPFTFGPAGNNWIPVAGDWDGNGTDTVGLFDPAQATFFISNSNTSGVASLTAYFGAQNLGWTPIAGDWDGDGKASIGLYDAHDGVFYLKNANTTGIADITVNTAPQFNSNQPVVGDWAGIGKDTVGIYDSVAHMVFVYDTNATGLPDWGFGFNPGAGGSTPLAGHWNGKAHPLHAAVAATTGDAAALTAADLDPIVASALQLFQNAGLSAAQLQSLAATQFVITNLQGNLLGMEDSGTIFLDANAAGYGWFVDASPDQNEEFSGKLGSLTAIANGPASGKMDLLSTVLHEMGHVIGLDDVHGSENDVMGDALQLGQRRVDIIDAVFQQAF